MYGFSEKEINFLAPSEPVPCMRILFLKKPKRNLRFHSGTDGLAGITRPGHTKGMAPAQLLTCHPVP